MGALRRCRKIPDAETLLRILLIHLADGCSLRETAARIKHGGIAQLSDVAILARLRQSGDWLRWLNLNLMTQWHNPDPVQLFGPPRRLRLVDATTVNEPGPTGSSWAVHYAVCLNTLLGNEFHAHDPRGGGATFGHFTISPRDLMMGDQAYGTPPSVAHVVRQKGDVLVRLSDAFLPLYDASGQRIMLPERLHELAVGEVAEWEVVLSDAQGECRGRIGAVKKSRQAASVSLRHLQTAANQQGTKPTAEALALAPYVTIFTTLGSAEATAATCLEFYRACWQIELVFKRMKSLMAFGHLRKHCRASTEAWLQGKLLVALLSESMLRHGESYSPWGYPLDQPEDPQA